jgi:hypothetical protein
MLYYCPTQKRSIPVNFDASSHYAINKYKIQDFTTCCGEANVNHIDTAARNGQNKSGISLKAMLSGLGMHLTEE